MPNGGAGHGSFLLQKKLWKVPLKAIKSKFVCKFPQLELVT